jgi:hypothetical protein
MKRYLLFSGSNYYASGGWNDFREDYDTLEEAKEGLRIHQEQWWQIVDITTKTMVDSEGHPQT